MPSDQTHQKSPDPTQGAPRGPTAENPYVVRSKGTDIPRWLDRKRNVDKLVYALVALSLALLLVDPLIHKHGPFQIEHLIGFYGLYSAVACLIAVLAGRALRTLVMRPEDYYDR